MLPSGSGGSSLTSVSGVPPRAVTSRGRGSAALCPTHPEPVSDPTAEASECFFEALVRILATSHLDVLRSLERFAQFTVAPGVPSDGMLAALIQRGSGTQRLNDESARSSRSSLTRLIGFARRGERPFRLEWLAAIDTAAGLSTVDSHQLRVLLDGEVRPEARRAANLTRVAETLAQRASASDGSVNDVDLMRTVLEVATQLTAASAAAAAFSRPQQDLMQTVRVRVGDAPVSLTRSAAGVSTDESRGSSVLEPTSEDLAETVVWQPEKVPWRSVVVRGNAGLGKTWLLRHHAATVAGVALRRSDLDEVPQLVFFADCAAWARMLPPDPNRRTIIDAVVEASLKAVLSDKDLERVIELTRRAQRVGQVFVCLDAFDEVPHEFRERARRGLAYFDSSSTRVVLASRPGALAALDDIPIPHGVEVGLVGFGTADRDSFLSTWFDGRPRDRRLVVEAIRTTPSLESLTRIPLMAAFVCRLADETGHVPERSVDIRRGILLGLLSGRWRETPGKRAIEPEAPPDAEARLRCLGHAMAELASGWRGWEDTMARSGLIAALRSAPDYDLVETGARRRRDRWREMSGANETTLEPDDFVLWELLFDGVLVEDLSTLSPACRMVHRVLHETAIAAHVAQQSPAESWASLSPHRWFDLDWDDVFTSVAEMATNPLPLLEKLFEEPSDAWHEQLFRASRCAAAARVVDELTIGRMVDRCVAVARSHRAFDRDRAVDALNKLAATANRRVISTLESVVDEDGLAASARLGIAIALNSVDRAVGRAVVREVLADRSAPIRHRLRAARALLLQADANDMQELTLTLMEDGDTDFRAGLAEVIAAADTVDVDTKVTLIEEVSLPPDIRGAIARGVVFSSEAGRTKALALLENPRIGWVLKAQIAGAALRSTAAPDPAVTAATRRLVENPNLPTSVAASLALAMLESGDGAVLELATRLTTSSGRVLDWTARERLARAVAAHGEDGCDLLFRTALDQRKDIGTRVRAIAALVGARHADGAEYARTVIRDAQAPLYVRARVAEALITAGDPEVVVTALDLLESSDLEGEFERSLCVTLLRAGVTDAIPHARAILERSRDVSDREPIVVALLSLGDDGARAVRDMALDASAPIAGRAQLAIALAGSSAAPIAWDLIVDAPEDMPRFMRHRVLVRLARWHPVPQVAQLLLELLADTDLAYRSLYDLVRAPRVAEDTVKDCITPVWRATTVEPAAGSAGSKHDLVALMKSVLPEDVSEQLVHRNARVFHGRLQTRVGIAMATLMTQAELDEMEQIQAEALDDASEWLESHFPGYDEVVQQELAAELEDFRRSMEATPSADEREDVSALRFISDLASAIDHWVRLLNDGAFQEAAQILGDTPELARPEAIALVEIATAVEPYWPDLAAAHYLLSVAHSASEGRAQELLVDSDVTRVQLHLLLDAGRGQELIGAAGLATLQSTDDASSYFYASLGAVLEDEIELAVALMGESAERASDDQRAQATQTIIGIGQVHRLDQALVQALCDVLNGVGSSDS